MGWRGGVSLPNSPFKEEIKKLTGKLEHYADKQKLLDHTSQLLESKEADITRLKEKLSSLEHAKSALAKPKGRLIGETKRIVQLEKQVRELEKVIQKKFPNSLSALILAANSSTELELENKYVHMIVHSIVVMCPHQISLLASHM